MCPSTKDFIAIVDLNEGTHEYKFCVDGEWMHNPNEPTTTPGGGERDSDRSSPTRKNTAPPQSAPPQGTENNNFPPKSRWLERPKLGSKLLSPLFIATDWVWRFSGISENNDLLDTCAQKSFPSKQHIFVIKFLSNFLPVVNHLLGAEEVVTATRTMWSESRKRTSTLITPWTWTARQWRQHNR